MPEATHEFARRVAQTYLHSGNDSYLRPETASRQLLIERRQFLRSSDGGLPKRPDLPPLENGDQ